MEYDEMMFLANMRRQAKVEFENNLWKRRFEELNGFPMEEGLFKENIIMPFSENDYLENKNLNTVTELMDNKGKSEEFEIQRTDNRFSGYCNPTKVVSSYYPNQISIIEGIIRVSTFCDDFSDCFSKEKLGNFIIGYFDPIIERNILRDENGEEKHTVFNAFHSEMMASYDSDMSLCKVFDEEDGICVMFRLQFNMEIGCFLNIPIDFLEKFVKIEKSSYIHLYSSKDGIVTLDEIKNYN